MIERRCGDVADAPAGGEQALLPLLLVAAPAAPVGVEARRPRRTRAARIAMFAPHARATSRSPAPRSVCVIGGPSRPHVRRRAARPSKRGEDRAGEHVDVGCVAGRAQQRLEPPGAHLDVVVDERERARPRAACRPALRAAFSPRGVPERDVAGATRGGRARVGGEAAVVDDDHLRAGGARPAARPRRAPPRGRRAAPRVGMMIDAGTVICSRESRFAASMVLFLHNRYRAPAARSARSSDLAVAGPRAPRRGGRAARARLGGARARARGGAALLRGGLRPDEVARRGAPHRRPRRPRPQPRPRRSAGGRSRRRARRGARVVVPPAPVPPRLRGRGLLHGGRGVHPLPRAQHAARRAPQLPRQRRPRRSSTPPRSRCWQRRMTRALRRRDRAERVRAPSAWRSSARRSRRDPRPARTRCRVAGASARGAGSYALFAGRLEPEKGLGVAIEACRIARHAARRRRRRLRAARASRARRASRFDGHVDERALAELRDGARLASDAVADLPRPSASPPPRRWPPGFPVAASRIGALPEIVPGDGSRRPATPARSPRRSTRLRADPAAREIGLSVMRASARRARIDATLAADLLVGFRRARDRHRRRRLHRLQPRRRADRPRRRGHRHRRPLDRPGRRTSTGPARAGREATACSTSATAKPPRRVRAGAAGGRSSTSRRRSTCASRSPIPAGMRRSTSAGRSTCSRRRVGTASARVVNSSTGGAIYGDAEMIPSPRDA